METIKRLFLEKYNLELTDLQAQQGGWAALAYKVCSNERIFFLKVYEKSRASTPKWTSFIDHYVPITVWLMDNSRLTDRLPVPVPTLSGDYKCEDDEAIYLLYEYIEGETVGDRDLTAKQAAELAAIIAELHLYGDEIPVETEAIRENFAVPFLAQMKETLDRDMDKLSAVVREFLLSCRESLVTRMNSLEQLSADLKEKEIKMALCHTDLHHWNLMQSDECLILIDWEGLKLAPVEADLMFVQDKSYYDEFMAVYCGVHRGFTPHRDVLQFYRHRRKLEDIWEFMEQLLFDRQDERARAETIRHLIQELTEIED
ncbi:phosphotransferase [Paenibacillus ginsengarvi]|uniref:Aminoglycoside phosphotransferase family protein n=1 Tax=Paenibacillus ginsengarvi TaxID=400777 RepID=A0A3B0BRD9_9BACL|nr:phosphotransferase [Paenibacillus ginsengarvi]RKN75885.1 aminoglycoside phosphotransferase family protein [Paenibacillus ginsengarvi]